MSNLSELLPAGAGAKSASFVASGTLGSGVTVGLKADGTVEAVAETTVSPSMPLGTQTEFAPRHSVLNNIAADPHNSNRWVIVWADDDGSEDVLVRIITLSGTTWTLSSEINMGLSGSVSRTPSVAWDKATANKIVITYNNSSNDGSAKVGTISGSAGSESIAFGAEHTFTTQTMYSYSRNPPQLLCLDNSGNYFQAFVGSTGYNTSVYGIILQAPSTTVTSGSEATLTTTAKDGASSASIVPTDSTKVIFSYLETTQEKPALKQLSISGTSITVGSENLGPTLTADEGFSITAIDATKIVMITTTNGTKYPAYQISTNSSGSFSFGTLTVITSDRSLYVNASNNLSGDPSTFITSYTNSSGTRYARAKVGTINAGISSISFNTETQLSTTVFSNYANIAQQSDSSGNFAYLFERTGGDKSFIVLGKTGGLSTNSTDFIGITDQAIADTATGAVIVQGGVITNTGLIPVAAVSFGTASSPASQGMYNTRMAYDSTSNKIVLAYEDQSNSNYGTAVIGTISGTTISWGTPVVFNSASTADGSIDVVYDPDQNKSVIVYRDIGNSGYGTAIVGTVSGTTISFGSEVVFSTRSSYYINATYDTAQDKVLIVFADGTAPSYAYTGYMVVGTVSGSSISFGSEVQFESSTISGTALALQYDASASKSLIVYAVSSANYAASITISGTTPSIGTKNNWASTSARNTEAVYIASSSKCVFAYSTTATDSPSFSAVATIDSGTGNVTVAASSSIVSATAQNERGLAYDIGAGSLVYVYNATNNYMSVVLGSISGDSVTWGEPTVLDSSGYANANFPATVYNSTEEKTVIAYRNATDSQSVVTNITANTPLTPNTDYYVQADGTLSTTVSSVPAGRALSSTSILLEG